MTITKYQLKEGQKIKMEWKGKVYQGIVKGNPIQESKKSAQLTRGRFISIPIITETGTIKQMPYTSRANYEIIS